MHIDIRVEFHKKEYYFTTFSPVTGYEIVAIDVFWDIWMDSEIYSNFFVSLLEKTPKNYRCLDKSCDLWMHKLNISMDEINEILWNKNNNISNKNQFEFKIWTQKSWEWNPEQKRDSPKLIFKSVTENVFTLMCRYFFTLRSLISRSERLFIVAN